MTALRIQHSIQDISLLSRDRYVNSFYVSTTAVSDAALWTFLTNAVKDFYAVGTGGAAGIEGSMSPACDGVSTSVKIYDLDTPNGSKSLGTVRPPLVETLYTFAANGTQPLPTEVALCLSYAAAPVATIRPSRLRGRIYIGPLSSEALSGIGTGPTAARPRALLCTTIVAAYGRLQAALKAHSPACSLQVYSPTIRGSNPTAAGAMHGVVRAWCDDSWDTQRRRGDRPTTQTSLTLP